MVNSSLRSWRGAFWQAADLAGRLRLAVRGTGDGGEAEGEAAQVFAGAVDRLAVLGDCAEQLAHGAVEAIGEPVSFEDRHGFALGGRERHSLHAQVRSAAAERALRAADEGMVPAAELDEC